MIFSIAVNSDIFKMAPYYDDVYNRRQTAMLALKRKSDGDAWDAFKRRRLDDGSDVIELPVHFNK